jgi:hypothetical protein
MSQRKADPVSGHRSRDRRSDPPDTEAPKGFSDQAHGPMLRRAAIDRCKSDGMVTLSASRDFRDKGTRDHTRQSSCA